MLVDEPGAVTPIFMPFRSAGDLYAAAFAFGIAEHDAGVSCPAAPAPRWSGPSPAVDRVLVRAGHEVGAAADQRLQRLRAAGEIGDLDVEALVLEIALPLGDRQRQVVEQRLAADADGELRLLGGLRGRTGRRRRRRTATAQQNADQATHDVLRMNLFWVERAIVVARRGTSNGSSRPASAASPRASTGNAPAREIGGPRPHVRVSLLRDAAARSRQARGAAPRPHACDQRVGATRIGRADAPARSNSAGRTASARSPPPQPLGCVVAGGGDEHRGVVVAAAHRSTRRRRTTTPR